MATFRIRSQAISRDKLATFLKTPELIKQFENMSRDVAVTLPEAVGENAEDIERALTTANEAKQEAAAAQTDATEALDAATALKAPEYVVVSLSGTVPNARTLAVDPGLSLSDAGPDGALTLSPDSMLAAVQGLAASGLMVRTGLDSVEVREIEAASTRVTVTDGDAVAGNPRIDVNPQIVASTGDFKQRAAVATPAGWITSAGGTIGSAASGATNRANADTLALFTLWWTDFTDVDLPIFTNAGAASTRGASAAADWAADKRLTAPTVAPAGLLRGFFKL